MNVSYSAPTDPVSEAERLFAAAAAACGPRLEALAAGPPPLAYLNEARHLAPTFRDTLSNTATKATPQPEVSPNLGVGELRSLWPRLGSFDASLRWGETTVYGELKCGGDEKTLEACAWDALKCAFALRCGLGTGMLLLAGAPKTLWDLPARGCELFDDAHWDASDLRTRYIRGFKTWERDGYKPLRVPDRLHTIRGPRTEFDVNGEPWLLAVARVEPAGEGWLDWQPVLPAKESATERSSGELFDGPLDPEFEEQMVVGINNESWERFREGRGGSAQRDRTPRESWRQRLTTKFSRLGRGGRRTAFEIFYDQSLSTGQKERQLLKLEKHPPSEDEAQAAKDYIGSIYRGREYRNELAKQDEEHTGGTSERR